MTVHNRVAGGRIGKILDGLCASMTEDKENAHIFMCTRKGDRRGVRKNTVHRVGTTPELGTIGTSTQRKKES